MIAAILLCISIVACGQFGFYYWRAMVLSVSALPVSDRLRVAAKIATTQVGSRDFGAIMSTRDWFPTWVAPVAASAQSGRTMRWSKSWDV